MIVCFLYYSLTCLSSCYLRTTKKGWQMAFHVFFAFRVCLSHPQFILCRGHFIISERRGAGIRKIIFSHHLCSIEYYLSRGKLLRRSPVIFQQLKFIVPRAIQRFIFCWFSTGFERKNLPHSLLRNVFSTIQKNKRQSEFADTFVVISIWVDVEFVSLRFGCRFFFRGASGILNFLHARQTFFFVLSSIQTVLCRVKLIKLLSRLRDEDDARRMRKKNFFHIDGETPKDCKHILRSGLFECWSGCFFRPALVQHLACHRTIAVSTM